MLDKQIKKAIVNYLKKGAKTKPQIVNRFKAIKKESNKYISTLLSQMIEEGTLNREGKEKYCLVSQNSKA